MTVEQSGKRTRRSTGSPSGTTSRAKGQPRLRYVRRHRTVTAAQPFPRLRLSRASYALGMLVGRPGLSPQMIGRADELDRLARLVDADQSPAVALVGGEAGVGKTRLVRELIDRLPPGTVVHAGQADPGSLGRPFELLFDALATGQAREDERLALLADPGPPGRRAPANRARGGGGPDRPRARA